MKDFDNIDNSKSEKENLNKNKLTENDVINLAINNHVKGNINESRIYLFNI